MLNDRQKAILEFCVEGETPAAIAQYVGIAQPSIYAWLRQLEQLGMLRKNNERPAIFFTRGTEPLPEEQREIEYDPTLNVEFIKHSHNIFARAA